MQVLITTVGRLDSPALRMRFACFAWIQLRLGKLQIRYHDLAGSVKILANQIKAPDVDIIEGGARIVSARKCAVGTAAAAHQDGHEMRHQLA